MSFEPGTPLLQARGLGKRYLIYAEPHHRLLQGLLRKPLHREFWALQDVSFEIARGESVGIIGRNGSGKSTLLQMVAGILPPTVGEISVAGRVAALLELGAGFNGEFSGRENVYVSGSLLGMSRVEIEQAMPAILAFAEIGDHIDQPVKTYSSGMFVRLAFSVAVHSQPDVLIVDEALAVGDVYFQAKSQRRIAELRERGCTLLLVTHSVDALAKLCDRGMVLDGGRKVFDGDVKPAVAEYLGRVFGSRGAPADLVESAPTTCPAADNGSADAVDADSGVRDAAQARAWLATQTGDQFGSRPGYQQDEVRVGSGLVEVMDFCFAGPAGLPPVFEPFQRVELCVRYRASQPTERVVVGLQVHASDASLVYSTNTFFLDERLLRMEQGDALVDFSFDAALLPGTYHLSPGVSRYDEHGLEIEALDRRMGAIVITVLGRPGRAFGVADLDADIRMATVEDAA